MPTVFAFRGLGSEFRAQALGFGASASSLLCLFLESCFVFVCLGGEGGGGGVQKLGCPFWEIP